MNGYQVRMSQGWTNSTQTIINIHLFTLIYSADQVGMACITNSALTVQLLIHQLWSLIISDVYDIFALLPYRVIVLAVYLSCVVGILLNYIAYFSKASFLDND